jgi:membrane protein
VDTHSSWNLLKKTVTEWMGERPFRLSAALAYYTLFSLAPLLVVTVAIAGLFLGDEAARGEIFAELRGFVGESGAEAVQTAVEKASLQGGGVFATVLGAVMLLFGASAVFAELQDALNGVWDVETKPSAGLRDVVKKRLLSLSMVLVIGFLLLVSLAASAVLNGIGAWLGGLLPISAVFLEALNFAVSFGVITLLFAAIYKVLPDADIRWSDVWTGAIATSFLFTIGKSLIGVYLGQSGVASAYGAAGSVVVLLLWIYYSSLILFFGAEFTHTYAETRGSKPSPEPHARKTPEPGRARAGSFASAGHAEGRSARRASDPPVDASLRPRRA